MDACYLDGDVDNIFSAKFRHPRKDHDQVNLRQIWKKIVSIKVSNQRMKIHRILSSLLRILRPCNIIEVDS